MATETRIYAVKTHGKVRLVNASNKTQAINHVARDTITAEVAGQMELLGRAVSDVEQAGKVEGE